MPQSHIIALSLRRKNEATEDDTLDNPRPVAYIVSINSDNCRLSPPASYKRRGANGYKREKEQ